MKSKIIKLRSKVTIGTIRSSIRRFLAFISNTTNSEYVRVQTMIIYKNNDNFLLSKPFIIDLDSNEDRRYYIDSLINNYQVSKDVDTDLSKVFSLKFYYIETNKEEYDNYIKNILAGNQSTIMELNNLF